MPADPLKFLNDIEATFASARRDSTRRNLDAIEELRGENIRLKRELEEANERVRRLEQQVTQLRSTPVAPIQPQEQITKKSDGQEDDIAIRYSMMELD